MKGQVVAALIILTVSLFALALLWPTFHRVVILNMVPEMQAFNVGGTFIANYQNIFNSIPYFFIVLMFLWVWLFIHKRDADIRRVE